MPQDKAKRQKNAHRQPLSQVRIIGGQFKRRQLALVCADGLRPTPDRVRETIFNWLMGDIADSRVLDMCAGSGAFGFECISRGARSAVLIEPIKAQVQLLQQTAQTFGITKKVSIYQATAQTVLPTLDGAFDVVFIDPPYALNLWQTLINALKNNHLIHKDTIIYIEGDRPLVQMIDNSDDFVMIKQHQFGQIWAYLIMPTR